MEITKHLEVRKIDKSKTIILLGTGGCYSAKVALDNIGVRSRICHVTPDDYKKKFGEILSQTKVQKPISAKKEDVAATKEIIKET